MKITYPNLSTEGLILYPSGLAAANGSDAQPRSAREFLDSDRDFPEIVGFVPNLSEFATGDDYDVGAFEIKEQDSRVACVPANLAGLLPATQLIIDDLYAHAGAAAADQCQVSLQFFRNRYELGEHLLFDRIHRHATEGKMVIYVVTAIDAGDAGDHDVLGTEFYAPEVLGKRISRAQRASSPADFGRQFAARGIVAAPGGAIVRFSENTLHAAPDLAHALATDAGLWRQRGGGVRRSLLNIIASYKLDDATVYGRTRPPNHHRPSPVVESAERRGEYRAAAQSALAAREDAPAPRRMDAAAANPAPNRRGQAPDP